ncbi:MAG: hypothetical protein MUC53_01030 [Candidatus Contendobacter sp.]|nr:hypothetical protein [Candidatus Contendobacter sp.]
MAAKWGVDQTRISYRAATLGAPPLICGKASSTAPKYSPAEMEIIHRHCTDPAAQIRARLYRAGFYRSLASIRRVLHRGRADGTLGSRDDMLIDRDCISCSALAANMGVHLWAVRRWIDKGLLKAKPRHSDRDPYAMRLEDVKAFLVEYQQHWNHVLADKFFLVDMLSYTPKKTCRNAKRQTEAA